MKCISVFFGVAILFIWSCSPKTGINTLDHKLEVEDGFYLIDHICDGGEQTIQKRNIHRLQYNYRFVDSEEQTVKCIAVRTDQYVPLQLQHEPNLKVDPEKRKKLLLVLTEDAKQQLTRFTKKHLNKKTAIVISGEVVTMHKIRSVIDGGILQITRCTDDACEFLNVELRDNVVN